MKDIADRLREYRVGRGMSLQDMAVLLGTTRQALSNYERRSREPKAVLLKSFSERMGVNIDWLLGEDVPSAPNVSSLNGVVAKSIPIIGEIAAGTPILAVQNIIDTITLPVEFVDGADFGLVVRGDSMSPQIPSGSTVLCRQQDDVCDGEIAVVIIDGEGTLKRVKRYNGTLVLRSDNPLYGEMAFNRANCDNVRICGKAVRVLSAVT